MNPYERSQKLRIAVYGAGGLGGFYGARLACAGNDVAFIARGAHLAAIRERGLQVVSPLGDMHLPDVLATDDPSDVGPVDLVLVAVKTWQIPEVSAAMGPLLGERTVVLPFLNGVEASDELAAVVGADRVLGGLSKVFSKIESPGVIHHFTPNAFVAFGELDGAESERARGVARNVLGRGCRRRGLSRHPGRALEEAAARELVGGSRRARPQPDGGGARRPVIRSLIDRSIEEGLAVARATGQDIDPALQGRDVGVLPLDAGRGDRLDAARHHRRQAVRAGMPGTARYAASAPAPASRRPCTPSRTTCCCRWSEGLAGCREHDRHSSFVRRLPSLTFSATATCRLPATHSSRR